MTPYSVVIGQLSNVSHKLHERSWIHFLIDLQISECVNRKICFAQVWIPYTKEANLKCFVSGVGSAECVAETHLDANIGERLHLVSLYCWSIYVYYVVYVIVTVDMVV